MPATIRAPELITFLTGILLYGVLLWSGQRRFLKKLDLVFSKHGVDEPNETTVREVLEELNLDSAHLMFTMDRHANIAFQESKITLLYGHIGTRSPGGIRGPVWTLKKAVYALVDKTETQWANHHPAVFKYALSGYSYSVFWVNLDALIAESHYPQK